LDSVLHAPIRDVPAIGSVDDPESGSGVTDARNDPRPRREAVQLLDWIDVIRRPRLHAVRPCFSGRSA
jgi:hypothetical protein